MSDGLMLIERQLAKCRDESGQLDLEKLLTIFQTTYDEMRRERERTEHVILVMGEEVEELTQDLEARIEARAKEALELRERFDHAIDNITQGILLVGPDDILLDANQVAMDLLGITPDDFTQRTTFLTMLRRLYERGDFSNQPEETVALWLTQPIGEQPTHYTRIRPNGQHLEIRTTRLPDGSCVRTYTDVTERHHSEQALMAAEREYRTLFDNAEAGIYRAGMNGAVIRANTAMARLHGHENEKSLLDALRDEPRVDWYVDKERGRELRNTVLTHGRVQDFVCEIYRHRTRERVWVSQTVWLVRAPDGEPLCFEGMMVDSTPRVQAEQRILELSRNDPLTDLPNRRTFIEYLGQAFRRMDGPATAPAVLYLDLDRFKFVNDTLGHAMGDLLLKAVVRRLQLLMDEGSVLARLGGDEFIILTLGLDRNRITAMAERLIAGLNRPFVLRGQRAAVGLSIGIAFSSADAAHPDELIKMADIALYAAKSAGKSRALIFESGMAEKTRRRQAVEQMLRDSLKIGEFYLLYQPIVDAPSGKIQCHEALMRWDCKSLGRVSPVEFVPIAEEIGVIHALGQWALRQACTDTARHFPESRIAVNVSAVQLRSPHFKSFVVDALATSGLAPDSLEIEITESVLISDDQFVLSVLRELRDIGVRVVLDDFGTGYSSLIYLQKFPFDKIKIDRGFISNASENNTNGAIIRAIIGLAKELGVELVAEGIETHSQAEDLVRAGCLLHQGYLYGRPEPVKERARRAQETTVAVLVPRRDPPAKMAYGSVHGKRITKRSP